jgi:hypothetical protein
MVLKPCVAYRSRAARPQAVAAKYQDRLSCFAKYLSRQTAFKGWTIACRLSEASKSTAANCIEFIGFF